MGNVMTMTKNCMYGMDICSVNINNNLKLLNNQDTPFTPKYQSYFGYLLTNFDIVKTDDVTNQTIDNVPSKLYI